MGIRTWASLAAFAVPATLAPTGAGAATPQAGGQFFGATSQNGVLVARVSGDRRRVAWLDIDVVGRCRGRRLIHPVKVETLYLRGFPLGADGTFNRSGRVTRFNSGPDEAGHYPVVVTGELRGHFPRPGRLRNGAADA